MTPLESEPGSRYKYSNAGINTAARILEVVSGKSFETFLAVRMFEPLGMSDTTFWPSEQQVSRIAKSYRPTADKKGIEVTSIEQLFYPLSDRQNRFPMPAGGLFSTARDIAAFYQMLLNEGSFGHGGAYSTNTVADRKDGLIFVWLVQHAGFKGEGAKSQDAFRSAASKAYLRLKSKE